MTDDSGDPARSAASTGRKGAVFGAIEDAARVVRDHGAEFALVLVGTTLPRITRRVTQWLRVSGWIFVAVGVFAVLRPAEFVAFLPFILGAMFLAQGLVLLYAGRWVRESTSAVRLIEKALEALKAKWELEGSSK